MSGKVLKNSLIGAAAGIAAAILLLLIFGFIALKNDDPDSLVSLTAHAARFIGAAATGFIASRLNKENGLLCGAFSGVFYSFVILLAAAFSDGEFRFLPSILICLICIVVSGVFGIIGLPGEKSGNARRKELMKRSGLVKR